jgi:hypothetical protein
LALGESVLSLRLGVALGLLPVDEVEALGLDEPEGTALVRVPYLQARKSDLLVDLSADEAGEELLGQGVGRRLAVLGLVLLVG